MKIAFLHTAQVHVATFDALLEGSGAEVAHLVAADLLASAQTHGAQAVRAQTMALLQGMATSDAVVCTCSTLGAFADALNLPHVFRIDRPAFEAAVACGPRVLLVICLDSTRDPSEALLADCAGDGALAAETLLCDQLWPLFEAGDIPAFSQGIATEVRRRIRKDAFDSVILAQASMKDAAPLLADIAIPVFTTPQMAVRAALALAEPDASL